MIAITTLTSVVAQTMGHPATAIHIGRVGDKGEHLPAVVPSGASSVPSLRVAALSEQTKQ